MYPPRKSITHKTKPNLTCQKQTSRKNLIKKQKIHIKIQTIETNLIHNEQYKKGIQIPRRKAKAPTSKPTFTQGQNTHRL